MSNSERAKYYRRKNALAKTQLDHAIATLQREIEEVEIKLAIQRQLVMRAFPDAQPRIIELIWRFVTSQLASATRGLSDNRVALDSIMVLGDAEAPIVQIRTEIQGRLLTRVVHDIYPFILGNTVVLDALMHRDVVYASSYVFFFAPDGSLLRQETHVDTANALSGILPNPVAVARVLTHVNLHEPRDT